MQTGGKPRDEERAPNPYLTLSELFRELADEEFAAVHREGVAKVLRQALEEIRRMKQTWQALEDEEKLLEIANAAPWRPSRTGEGEYVAADLVPTLAAAVKAKQGRLYAGNYVYVLSRNGKWIQRYVRQRPQAPPQRAREGGESK
jgi:hypothetical protein